MTVFENIFKWNQIPRAVRQFLLKGAIILVLWKVIYFSFLLPGRVLDAPLTTAVGIVTTQTLNLITRSSDYSAKSELGRMDDIDLNPVSVPQESVYFKSRKIVGIYDGCNGLELMMLYAGFIICLPALISRKLVFIIGGIIMIFIVNVLRCVGVAYLLLYYPKQADFAHHYIFAFIVYAFIIALWLWFANGVNIQRDEKK